MNLLMFLFEICHIRVSNHACNTTSFDWYFFGEMTATPKKLSLCSNDVEEDANTADELRSMWNCDTYQFGETCLRYRIAHLSDIELAYKRLLSL